jgi:ABC-type phosphate transport system substrate-binding protein
MSRPLWIILLAGAAVLAAGAIGLVTAQDAGPDDDNTLGILADDAAGPLAETLKSLRNGPTVTLTRLNAAEQARIDPFLDEETSPDLLITALPLTRDEIVTLQTKRFQPPIVTPLAQGALCVVIHAGNPALAGTAVLRTSGLSIEELRAIFAGEMTSWDRWGGGDITVIVPPVGSDDRELFERVVMRGSAITDSARVVEDTAEMQNLFSGGQAGAISFCSMAYADREPLVVLPVSRRTGTNGVLPTKDNVVDSPPRYPLARTLFAYTLGDPTGAAERWLAGALSDDGQDRVENAGYYTTQ